MVQGQNELIRFSSGSMLPQEEVLETGKKKKNITIGILKEKAYQENRIPLIPEAVQLLVANNHRILMEAGSGENAGFSDRDFAEMGASIKYHREEVFQSDLLIKVAPLTEDELNLLPPNKAVLSALNLPGRDRAYFEKLLEKRITAVAFEYVKDKTGIFPFIRAMSEITGTACVFIGAEYLSYPELGKGKLLGGFPGIAPTEVVILGSGAVAEYAVRASLGFGAQVKVFDNDIYKLRRLKNAVGTQFFTSTLQPELLQQALQSADLAIGAAHSSTGITPCLISEEMVQKMKSGAVIIDVSIDHGGCFESSRQTSHKDPVFIKYDIIHYCVPNIASRYPNTASTALSNINSGILLNMGEVGGIEMMIRSDQYFRQGVYQFNGKLTKQNIGEYYQLSYHDIDLLIASSR